MTVHEERLRSVLRESVATVEPAPDALERLLAPPPRRRPIVLVGAAVLVALVVGGLVVRAMDESPARVTTPADPAEALPPPAERIAALTAEHLDVIDGRDGSVVRRHRLPSELEGYRELGGFTAGKEAAVVFVEIPGDAGSPLRRVAWTVDLDTGTVDHLLDGTRAVAFSPDGSALAYVPLGPAGSGEAVVRRLTDGSERRFGFDPGDFSDLDDIDGVLWAPDSRQLAVIRGYYGYDTFVVDTTGPEIDLSSMDPTYRDFAALSWPELNELSGHHYCCGEDQPPDPARYRDGNLVLLDPALPGATLSDHNDLDGRPLTIVLDDKGQSPTLVVGGLRLPGYSWAAW